MTDLEEKALALYWKGWEFGWDNPYNLAASILGLLFAPPEMRESLLPYSRLNKDAQAANEDFDEEHAK
jgi:hypothetical protein